MHFFREGVRDCRALNPTNFSSIIARTVMGRLVRPSNGAVAQLGERMTGSHEVRGSIPLGSTKHFNLKARPHALVLSMRKTTPRWRWRIL